jgi:pimeloyl-ACP methyl ester carboxylesterase
VYAPAYRQASGAALIDSSESGQRALELAYADVAAAFREFRRRTAGRPFLLAGHSQGAAHAARLLREHIAPGEARQRLVAAYLIGAPLAGAELGGVPACASPNASGCVVTFNARGPGYERTRFEYARRDSAPEPWCVNPTLGAATSRAALAAQHGGAVFFDAARPALLPAFAASRCEHGRLVVTELRELPRRGLPSGVLLWVLGGRNYHPIEYQLFYADLRRDAARRVAAFMP